MTPCGNTAGAGKGKGAGRGEMWEMGGGALLETQGAHPACGSVILCAKSGSGAISPSRTRGDSRFDRRGPKAEGSPAAWPQVSVTGGEAASAQGCRPWTESGLDPRASACGDGFFPPPPTQERGEVWGGVRRRAERGGDAGARASARVLTSRGRGPMERASAHSERSHEPRKQQPCFTHIWHLFAGEHQGAGALGHSLKKSCFFPKVSSNFD